MFSSRESGWDYGSFICYRKNWEEGEIYIGKEHRHQTLSFSLPSQAAGIWGDTEQGSFNTTPRIVLNLQTYNEVTKLVLLMVEI